jgi:hypothetical protein
MPLESMWDLTEVHVPTIWKRGKISGLRQLRI